MWTSGSLKNISTTCGQQKVYPNFVSGFHIALNFFSASVPQVWTSLHEHEVPLFYWRIGAWNHHHLVSWWNGPDTRLILHLPFVHSIIDAKTKPWSYRYRMTYTPPEVQPESDQDPLLGFSSELQPTWALSIPRIFQLGDNLAPPTPRTQLP